MFRWERRCGSYSNGSAEFRPPAGAIYRSGGPICKDLYTIDRPRSGARPVGGQTAASVKNRRAVSGLMCSIRGVQAPPR